MQIQNKVIVVTGGGSGIGRALCHRFANEGAKGIVVADRIGSAPYSLTKHAVVSLAEWLSITHYASGIRISCLCPQGVQTPMLDGVQGSVGDYLKATAVSPQTVADAVVVGLAEERFLILPHTQVATFFQHKANDYDRWLRGMRRLQDQNRKPL